jgi:hypothetical protein
MGLSIRFEYPSLVIRDIYFLSSTRVFYDRGLRSASLCDILFTSMYTYIYMVGICIGVVILIFLISLCTDSITLGLRWS